MTLKTSVFIIFNLQTNIPGKFAHYNFFAGGNVSFALNTDPDGINGTNEQCLIYYYHMSNGTRSEHTITIRIEERGKPREIIDSIGESPFNGWIERQVNFNSTKPGYKVIFSISM